ncbi:MAG: flagellar basal body-associated FliL family protein [Hyphomicrobiaceae bacterium]
MAGDSKAEADGGGKGFLIALVLTVVIGMGAGAAFALAMLPKGGGPESKGEAHVVAAHGAGQAKKAHSAAKDEKAARTENGLEEFIVPLAPVIVNVSGKGDKWLRMEGSVAFSAPPGSDKTVLLAYMVEDLAGFLRTTSLKQIESSAGLEFLRDDISELVRLRSKGRARRFILTSLVVE